MLQDKTNMALQAAHPFTVSRGVVMLLQRPEVEASCRSDVGCLSIKPASSDCESCISDTETLMSLPGSESFKECATCAKSFALSAGTESAAAVARKRRQRLAKVNRPTKDRFRACLRGLRIVIVTERTSELTVLDSLASSSTLPMLGLTIV